MRHRLTPIKALAAACGLFCMAGPSHSQNIKPPKLPAGESGQIPGRSRRLQEAPTPTPFRSADGKITGWKIVIPGERPLATPAIAEGKVFVGGGFGSHEFYAFDAVTGQPIWTYRTADDGPTAAVVEDGIIAFNTESCELEVITTSGRPLWKKWLGDPLMSMPAIAGGAVFMAYPDSHGDAKYRVAAFDLKNGAELWKHPLAGEIITAPVIDHERVYLATLDGSVLALNRRDGGQIWQEDANATSAPAVWNDHCYFSRRQAERQSNRAVQQTEMVSSRAVAPESRMRDLPGTQRNADYLDYSKRAASVSERKSQSFDASVGFAGANKGGALMAPAQANLGQASVHGIWAYQGSKPFIDHGRLYSSMGDRTQSVDPETGKVLWSRVLNSGDRSAIEGVLTPPVIVNGKVFVGTSTGELYALSAQTGEVLWKVDIGEPLAFQPAVSEGRVYIATSRGALLCLNTNDAGDDGWLMWGGNAAHNGLTER